MKNYVDDKYEKLSMTIQKMLDGNPVILVGSGGSIPYGLPSMSDLAKEITKKLAPEFETHDSWKSFIQELASSGDFEQALGKVTIPEEMHNAIIGAIWASIDHKDRAAISDFLKNGSQPTITAILRKFVQQTNPTNIITTNYDRIIEYAIDTAEGLAVTGFSGFCIKGFSTSNLNITSKRSIRLFKVHGSIDWFRHRTNQSLLSTSFFSDALKSHYAPMIVTPGIEKYKETYNDPFRTVIAEADKALRNSPSYLCIGYGFNDEHIQPIIIDENRNKNKPIVIITKQITDKMKELFLNGSSTFLIICENPAGGSTVHYSSSVRKDFPENYWCIDAFYKIWFE